MYMYMYMYIYTVHIMYMENHMHSTLAIRKKADMESKH